MYPHKSQLVFNIGVTGHRNINPDEEQYLKVLSRDILKFISDTVVEIKKDLLDFYTDDIPKLRLITSLAEGFDRTAAHAALDFGYEIQCPLPFSRDDYSLDFQTRESKMEFYSLLQKTSAVYELNFGRDILDKPYLNAGTVLLEHTDILLAFWDGLPAKGPGGTGDIVELAAEKSIPVIHIKKDMEVVCEKKVFWKEAIEKEIRGILTPFEDIKNEENFPYIYFNENLERKSYAPVYNYIVKLFSPKYNEKDIYDTQSSTVSPTTITDFNQTQYFDYFFQEADSLAVLYSDYYRSAGSLRALIPLIANIALAVGFYWRWGENSNIINVIGFSLQVVLLYWMVRVIGERNEKNKWHQKFIDYRILAECLKNQSFLVPFGITLREVRISAYNKNDSISWINWQLRNVIRDLGLPNIAIDKSTLEDALSNLNNKLIVEQINYHKKNWYKIGVIAKRLEKLAVVLFTLGALATVTRVIIHYACQINPNLIWLPSPEHKVIKLPTFINMISLLLPAFGTAAFSLGGQAGFDKLVQRHNYMQEQLKNMSDEINEPKDESFLKIRNRVFKIISFMIDEVADWRMFIKSKGISKR
jgi:hypothetical protein